MRSAAGKERFAASALTMTRCARIGHHAARSELSPAPAGEDQPRDRRSRPLMGASPFRLRDARARDLDAIDRLEGASFSTADRFSRRALSRAIRNETASVTVAELNEIIIGYVLLLFRKGATAARLYSLAIAPGARGTGAARALVDAAATKALDRGCARLRLEVRESNLAARRLYERAGFTLLATKPDYYEDGETALQMEKRLDMRERETR